MPRAGFLFRCGVSLPVRGFLFWFGIFGLVFMALDEDDTLVVNDSVESYGSVEQMNVKTRTQDIADIKSYHKHRSTFRWRQVTQELWKQKFLILIVFLLEVTLLIIGLVVEDWRSMSWEAWVSIEITIITLYLLIANYFPPGFVFLAAMSICYGLNIIDSEQAFEGFSNTGVITVGVLVRFSFVLSLTLSN